MGRSKIMLQSILEGISQSAASVTTAEFFWCTAASLVLGVLAALLFMFRNEEYSPSLAVTLALVVQVVILLVNGNLGAGVAVMGAFSLVRFRSAAGSAREIAAIFHAMAIGLCTGMGYIGIAAILLAVYAAASLTLNAMRFGEKRRPAQILRITIPESLDYDGVFDESLETYTKRHELSRVRTVNMGALYELEYRVTLKDEAQQKAFLDELRCRNGNLRISLGRPVSSKDEL
jgi:hypothetical protein